MPRLGRQRREHAQLRRSPSATTPTPLVRKRLVIEQDGANGAWRWYGRIKRGRRPAARIVRARSVPTATPLVRKRTVQVPNGNDRAHRIRLFRPRLRVIVRQRFVFVIVLRPRPVIGTQGAQRATLHTRFFRHRVARIERAASTPTATPLIRKRFVQASTGVERAAVRGRWFKRRARLIVRSPVIPTLAAVKQTVILSRRRARVRARQRVRVTRAILTPFRSRPAIVGRSRSAHRIRLFRARSVTTPIRPAFSLLTATRPRIIVRSRKAQRAYFARHRSHLETSTLGTTGTVITIITTSELVAANAITGWGAADAQTRLAIAGASSDWETGAVLV